jgi:hypothetical protein
VMSKGYPAMTQSRSLQASGLILTVLLAGACGSVAPAGSSTGSSVGTSGVSVSRPATIPGHPSGLVAAPLPPPQACVTPSTVADVQLGERVVVEATIAHGHAVSDNYRGSIIPLVAVKVLLGSVPSPPQEIEADLLPPSDADLLLDEGRYILLLGSSIEGHYYLAMGRRGAFAFSDASGSSLVQMCTEYSADGKAHSPVRAPGSIDRNTLLELVAKTVSQPTASPVS